jgi:hypothetical protein
MVSGNFAEMTHFIRHLGIFYMPKIYDMGSTALLPLWRKACWRFFRLKNQTASANMLNTRPRKPLDVYMSEEKCVFFALIFSNHNIWWPPDCLSQIELMIINDWTVTRCHFVCNSRHQTMRKLLSVYHTWRLRLNLSPRITLWSEGTQRAWW